MATHDVVAIVTQSDELCKIENKKFSFDVTIVFEKPSKFVKKRQKRYGRQKRALDVN